MEYKKIRKLLEERRAEIEAKEIKELLRSIDIQETKEWMLYNLSSDDQKKYTSGLISLSEATERAIVKCKKNIQDSYEAELNLIIQAENAAPVRRIELTAEHITDRKCIVRLSVRTDKDVLFKRKEGKNYSFQYATDLLNESPEVRKLICDTLENSPYPKLETIFGYTGRMPRFSVYPLFNDTYEENGICHLLQRVGLVQKERIGGRDFKVWVFEKIPDERHVQYLFDTLLEVLGGEWEATYAQLALHLDIGHATPEENKQVEAWLERKREEYDDISFEEDQEENFIAFLYSETLKELTE